MKEILFRAKSKCTDKWVYGSLISTGDYCCILESEENVHPMDYPYLDSSLGTIDGTLTPVIPKTVSQFTGFMDKDDVKVFEGDVFVHDGKWTYRVYWDEVRHGFYATSDDPSETDYLGNFFEHNAKVIGNVYDDPEYLNIGCEGW